MYIRDYSNKYEVYSANNVIERLIDYIMDVRKTEPRYIGVCGLYNFIQMIFIDNCKTILCCTDIK